MQIRAATENDADALAALYDEAALWLLSRGGAQWQPGSLSAATLLTLASAGQAFVATKNDAIIGAFLLTDARDVVIWPEQNPPRALYLSRLVVARSHQKSGVGAWLLNEAVRLTDERGFSHLRLDCWAGNTALQNFYIACGFTSVGVVPEETWEVQRFERR